MSLTQEQRNVLRDGEQVRSLAAWVLGASNGTAARARYAANLTRSADPTVRVISCMVDYLCGGGVAESDLENLVNGFKRASR